MIKKSLHLLLLALTLLSMPQYTFAIPTPSSDGKASLIDNPVFRIPFLRKAPKVDGKVSAKEWEDASALSGFWSSNTVPRSYPLYEYLAPHQIQSRVLAGYDKTHLYVCYRMKHYPEKSWLKARGRFPDVWKHPIYGIKEDDHLEFELRPIENLTVGYKKGFYKWFVNPIGTVSDQHWSLKRGEGKTWQSKAKIRAGTTEDEKWWQVEMAIPFTELRNDGYGVKDEQGKDLVVLPPPDGSVFRCWFRNGIGGFGHYIVLFDQHSWRVTKTRMILDSQSVSFQIIDLGPIMEDQVDVKLALKNHTSKSQSVRLGFFIESSEGNIFSSYDQEQTPKGLVELLPGERKEIRYKKKFPNITATDNYLWFDVRSAGYPAKVIYQNRLAKFHSTEPPPPNSDWREKKLDVIAKMRPPKSDYVFKYQYSPYNNKVSAYLDRGIHSASDEIKSAVEAKFSVYHDNEDEDEVVSQTVAFKDHFACFDIPLPHDFRLGSYKVSLLVFDADGQIVSERWPKGFSKGKFVWEKNRLGLEDIVWEPFTPISHDTNAMSLDTLKIKTSLTSAALPAQIFIKPDRRELPLEKRGDAQSVSHRELLEMGRGKQLRSPMRLEAILAGKRVQADVIEEAKLVKNWKSEHEFTAKLKAGPVDITWNPTFDCDGSFQVNLSYGSTSPVEIEGLELVMEVDGEIDSGVGGEYGMLPSSGSDFKLSHEEGVVWSSDKNMEAISLHYSRFVPWFYFGNGDRGFTWVSDSDKNWIIDEQGSTMTLERDAYGKITWRVKIVNHKTTLEGTRDISFRIITHPCKPREKHYRSYQWLDWRPMNGSDENNAHPNDGPWGIAGSDKAFEHFNKAYPNGAPRLYVIDKISAGVPEVQKGVYNGEWMRNSANHPNKKPMDTVGRYGQPWTRPGVGGIQPIYGVPSFVDYTVYHFDRQMRLGRVPGWFYDEPMLPRRSICLANGGAYFRDPAEVKKGQLPFHYNYTTLSWVSQMKRLSRLFVKNGLPNHSMQWATNAAAVFESYSRASMMVESAAAFSHSYEIDNVTRFPSVLWRFAAGTNRGLNVYVRPHHQGIKGFNLLPGDELRFDRQILGRALLHDIGVDGEVANFEQLEGLLNRLYEFGFFDDRQTEMIPYWRSRDYCQYGESLEEEGFGLGERLLSDEVHVTIYRRPHIVDNRRVGYKALFVIMNESDRDQRARFHIKNSKRIFGGDNNVTGSFVYENKMLPPALGTQLRAGFADWKALIDIERGGVVTKATRGHGTAWKRVKKETYGHLFVPKHDYRILYGHFNSLVDKDIRRPKVNPKTRSAYVKIRDTKQGPWWKAWDKIVEDRYSKESKPNN